MGNFLVLFELSVFIWTWQTLHQKVTSTESDDKLLRCNDDNARHRTMHPVKWWNMTDQWIANDVHFYLLNKGEATGANEMRENQATLNEMTSASFLSVHS